MATSRRNEKPRRQTAKEKVGPTAPAAGRRFRILRTAIVTAALAAVLIAGLGFYRYTTNRAALKRLPPPANLEGKTESLRAALAQADQKARQTPRSAEAVGALGMLYQANHFYEQADPCYALAMDLAPNVPEWPYFLAAVREVTGTSEMIESLIRKVLALSPDYLPARVKLGDLLLKHGDEAGAEQEYRRCLQQSPREAYALLGLGRVAVQQKRWQEAQEDLQLAVEVDPSFGAAYRLLATVYEAKGDADRSEMLRARAEMCGRFRAMSDPWMERLDDLCYDPLYLIVRSETASQTGDPKKQLFLLHRAVEVAPDDARPRLTVAQVLTERNELREALPYARKAVELDPKDEDALTGLGILLGKLRQVDEAAKWLQAGLRVNPDSTTAYQGLGMVSAARGDDAAAAASFRRACELSQYRFDQAISEYIGCLVRLKRQQEAIDLLRKILQSRPSATLVWSLLARVHVNLGDTSGALAVLREALTAAPYNPQLADSLAWLLASSPKCTAREAREAVRWARRAVDMANPKDVPDDLSTLAAAYARSGDFTQAIATQEQAVALVSQRGQPDKIAEFSRRLESFRAGRPVGTTREGS
jgi:tetratricopeptide (TPR) repeat protein